MSKYHDLNPEDVTAELIVYKMGQWKTDFWSFFVDCVQTVDESRNEVRGAPPYRYLKELVDIYKRSKIMVVNKSRRMYQTHFWCAYLLWAFLFEPYSENLIISINENRAKQLIQARFKPMLEHLPKAFPWPQLDEKRDILVSEIRNPVINSRIQALPSGPDKIRGFTVNNLFIDEFAFQKNCSETIKALKPALEGPNCRAAIVSTPQFGTAFQELVTKIKKGSPIKEHMIGVTEVYNEFNHTVVSLHYSADPKKRPGTEVGDKWFHAERYGTTPGGEPIPGASGVEEYAWLQEMELSFTVPTGKPVVPEFNKVQHCSTYTQLGQFMPERPLHVGVDFGTHFPAAVFLQADALNRCVIHNAIMAEDEELENFLVRIQEFIATEYPGVEDVRFYADPAGGYGNSQGTAAPAIELMKRFFKKNVQSMKSKPLDRARAMRSKFSRKVHDAMGVILNPAAGIHIRPDGTQRNGIMPEALETGWVYKEGKVSDNGTSEEIKKDKFYEHIMDAAGYVFIHVFPALYDKAVDFRTRGSTRKVKRKRRHLRR